MTALTYSQSRAEAQVDKSGPLFVQEIDVLPDPAEIEALKNEFFMAGIVAEIRNNPVAEALGISGVELWVQDERDFFTASKLYAEMQDRASGRCGGATVPPQAGAPALRTGLE